MRLLYTFLLILTLAVFASAQQPTPMPQTYVHDFANVITAEHEAEIQAKAERLKTEFKTEIAVVTVPSLDGQDSFDYSMKMARAWGIGSKDEDSRGLLLLVAPNERKIAFRTSRHTEGELTDGITGEISREMGKLFPPKSEAVRELPGWGAGLSKGMDRVLEKTQARYEAPRAAAAPSEGTSGWWWLLLFPVLGVFLWLLLRNKNREIERHYSSPSSYGNLSRPTSSIATAAVAPSVTPIVASSFGNRTRRSSSSSTPSRSSSRPSTPSRSSSSRSSSSPSRSSSSSSSSRSSSSESSSYTPSTSSYDYGSSSSSSSSDSGSSYGGSSDFSGGGSDSSF